MENGLSWRYNCMFVCFRKREQEDSSHILGGSVNNISTNNTMVLKALTKAARTG